MSTNVDIIIVGGGMVGASLAALLAKQAHFTVALIDQHPLPQVKPDDTRVSAIVPASIRLFKKIQAWEGMQQTRVSPYVAMSVWDSGSAGELHFNAKEIHQRELGFIIENSVIQTRLHDVLSSCETVKRILSVSPVSFQKTKDGVRLCLETGEVIQASLAIAADGAHSWLRTQADIAVKTQSQDDHAIIANVITEKPHDARARQLFLPTGPLAFLPLHSPHASSIVWSLPAAKAASLMQAEEATFNAALAQAFEHRLGAVKSVSARQCYPLCPQQATTYVKPGLALVGDAAHTMHPLAGLGVNLGLMDAACLADVLTKADHAGEDMGSYAVLRRYARWRAADNQPILRGVHALKQCFSIEQPLFKVLRGMGMAMTDRSGLLKQALVQIASLNLPS